MVEYSEIHTTTRADPVGICIYCGSEEGLSDEHVVPFGLGGRLVLPKATCAQCAAVTSAFEHKVLRGFMRDARTVGRFPTRRPEERPSTISHGIKRGDHIETVELPLDKSCGLLQLPQLERPAFLQGGSPVTGVNIIGFETMAFGKGPGEVVSVLGTGTFTITVTVDATAFVRMLAKIGYGFAVAVLGPFSRNEVPVLPLILGTADDGSTWVGSTEHRPSRAAGLPTHGLELISFPRIVDEIAETVYVARVKLFENARATGYDVVVRRRRVSGP
jgi:hypothetical protein